ncbi:MAG: O-methyltransferase [Myxococcales bacterium]|nr:O-methyltransferase [Myxococcales bacterium]
MADDDSRSGLRYTDPALLGWLDDLHAGLDPALRQAFEAPGQQGMPAIQVGRSEGRLLSLLTRLIGATKAVEVGTLAGFSAIHIARGLAPGGHLWSIEYDPHHAEVARANIAAAGLSDRVTVLVGAGQDVLPTLAGPVDLVFIDADKEGYDAYGRWAAANLRPGGLLLADNANYFGKLLDPERAGAAAVRRLHEEARDAFDTVCVPTPDGLLLGIRR